MRRTLGSKVSDPLSLLIIFYVFQLCCCILIPLVTVRTLSAESEVGVIASTVWPLLNPVLWVWVALTLLTIEGLQRRAVWGYWLARLQCAGVVIAGSILVALIAVLPGLSFMAALDFYPGAAFFAVVFVASALIFKYLDRPDAVCRFKEDATPKWIPLLRTLALTALLAVVLGSALGKRLHGVRLDYPKSADVAVMMTSPSPVEHWKGEPPLLSYHYPRSPSPVEHWK